LQVVEQWNSANGAIFYGKDAELTGPDRENQEVSMLALHLLQSALVLVNTRLVDRVLDGPDWAALMTGALHAGPPAAAAQRRLIRRRSVRVSGDTRRRRHHDVPSLERHRVSLGEKVGEVEDCPPDGTKILHRHIMGDVLVAVLFVAEGQQSGCR